MMMSELVRQPAEVNEVTLRELVGPAAQVYKKAEKQLNYSNFNSSLLMPASLTRKERVALALSAISIEPFSLESVRRYKREKTVWKNRFWNVVKFLASPTVGYPFLFLAIACVLAFVGFALAFGAGVSLPKFMHHVISWVALIGIPISFFMYANFMDSNNIYTHHLTWSLENLEHYEQPVPLFVLSRATDLSELLPEAKFYVESLHDREELLDPFLVMIVDGDRYYLDVWEEPKFEGRRQK